MKLKVSELAGLKGLYFINVLEWFMAIFLSSPLDLPYELGLVTKKAKCHIMILIYFLGRERFPSWIIYSLKVTLMLKMLKGPR